MMTPRVAFGMGKLSATQIGGTTYSSGMGTFLFSLAGYLTFGWATRRMEIKR